MVRAFGRIGASCQEGGQYHQQNRPQSSHHWRSVGQGDRGHAGYDSSPYRPFLRNPQGVWIKISISAKQWRPSGGCRLSFRQQLYRWSQHTALCWRFQHLFRQSEQQLYRREFANPFQSIFCTKSDVRTKQSEYTVWSRQYDDKYKHPSVQPEWEPVLRPFQCTIKIQRPFCRRDNRKCQPVWDGSAFPQWKQCLPQPRPGSTKHREYVTVACACRSTGSRIGKP